MLRKKIALWVVLFLWVGLIIACGGGGTREETNQTAVDKPSGDSGTSNSPGSQDGSGVPASEWIPHTKAAQQGDFRVSILGAKVGRVDLKSLFGDASSSADPLLQIRLRIENQGESRKVTFRGWGIEQLDFDKDEAAQLEDDIGNSYRRIHFGTSKVVGQTRHESLYPGKSLTDVVVFEEPVSAANELRLTLPAEAFGGEGMLRFRLPKSAVRGVEKPKKTPKAQPMPLPERESELDAKETPEPQPETKSEPKADPNPMPKAKTTPEPKPNPETKPETKAESEPDKEDPEELERKAAAKLRLADQFYDDGERSTAKRWYQDVVREYPETKAAETAQKKLDAMNRG